MCREYIYGATVYMYIVLYYIFIYIVVIIGKGVDIIGFFQN